MNDGFVITVNTFILAIPTMLLNDRSTTVKAMVAVTG
jgi:hypothetical protein